jgi:uncharacterized membrane protein YeiH
MNLPPPFLLDHIGVAVGAMSGVLAARGKQIDLFGVLVLAVVTAFGGATVRDLLVGDLPVVWLRGPWLLVNATLVGLLTFIVARWLEPRRRVFLVVDAFVLAAFAMIGTRKGLTHGLSAPICILLGVITGVAGGILRDVLLREVPAVFRSEIHLYATAALFGSVLCVGLSLLGVDEMIALFAGGGLVLLLRLAAIYWKLSLPLFEAPLKSPNVKD